MTDRGPEGVRGRFRELYGEEPRLVVRAPGRVNLIGEHTDYNEGFVFPMAIDREVRIALRPRPDRRVRVSSVEMATWADFDLDSLSRGQGWPEYLKGVAWSLGQAGLATGGFEGVMSGDVPRGSGLSSSAAVEMAVANAFAAVGGFAWDPATMAQACQRAENEWLGVNSGIMDQLISAAGRAGHAMLLDCRSLEWRHVPLPAHVAVLVLDTSTRRQLVGSGYNERREQCQAAARHFGVPALRDVDTEAFSAGAADLPEVIRRRARHVVTENERTLAAAGALEAGDVQLMGRLMDESHASLRDDFEVSSVALDAIVDAARSQAGCYGARLTGAGFGGCAVALVEAREAGRIAAAVAEEYRSVTGLEAEAYLCRPAQGAGPVAESQQG